MRDLLLHLLAFGFVLLAIGAFFRHDYERFLGKFREHRTAGTPLAKATGLALLSTFATLFAE